MSRSWWRCRNPACLVPHGAVLGRVTVEGGIVLDPAVQHFAVYLDTGRVEVMCPQCAAIRAFRGPSIRSAR